VASRLPHTFNAQGAFVILVARVARSLLLLAAVIAAGPGHAQSLTNGKELFDSYCFSCHGNPPAGGPERGAANNPAFIRNAFAKVPAMAFLGLVLNDAQLADIAAYVGLVLGATTPPPQNTANYTALWWNPAESGWGINFSHQENLVFGTLFTYDSTGAPLWLVMPAGEMQTDGVTFAGTLYRTTGSPFNANPFAGATATSVGTMSVSFGSSASTGNLTYTFNGVVVTKTIERQPVGTRRAACVPASGSRASLTNYQDLWYNASEPGWGINITQELTSAGETIFATLFTYDATGKGLWLVLADGARQSDGSFLGTLYQTSGSAFNANPFAGAIATVAGTMRLRFASGEAGTLSYTYNGVSVTKAITRQVIRNPAGLPACTS
jgi:mono/diheme cytochrome c family protein